MPAGVTLVACNVCATFLCNVFEGPCQPGSP